MSSVFIIFLEFCVSVVIKRSAIEQYIYPKSNYSDYFNCFFFILAVAMQRTTIKQDVILSVFKSRARVGRRTVKLTGITVFRLCPRRRVYAFLIHLSYSCIMSLLLILHETVRSDRVIFLITSYDTIRINEYPDYWSVITRVEKNKIINPVKNQTRAKFDNITLIRCRLKDVYCQCFLFEWYSMFFVEILKSVH